MMFGAIYRTFGTFNLFSLPLFYISKFVQVNILNFVVILVLKGLHQQSFNEAKEIAKVIQKMHLRELGNIELQQMF